MKSEQDGEMHFDVAYLTTKYPAVSHTFIRREIMGLESLGYHIYRMALRPSPVPLVDPADILEAEKTYYCVTQPLGCHLIGLARTALSRPAGFIRAVIKSIRMSRLSDRGLLRHLAYFTEASTILWQCRRRGIGHIHVHFANNATAVALIAFWLGGPTFSFTVHGPGELDSPIGFDLRGKIRDAQFVIAITHYCEAQLRRWCDPMHWKKIHVVRCSVGQDFFAASSAIPRGSSSLVSVGRFVAQKGHLTLVRAFAEVAKRLPEAKLVLVGDGDLRPTIEGELDVLGLRSHVEITGFVSEREVRQLMSVSRALVLASYAEGLPVVAMEAYALGRPVVATYIAGIPELIQHGKSGWLVPASDEEALAAVLYEVLTAPVTSLERMARYGRHVVQLKHSIGSEAAKIAGLLSAESRHTSRGGV